mgnify:CR=1 FL=1
MKAFLLTFLLGTGAALGQSARPLETSPALAWKFQTRGAVIGSPLVRDNVAYFGSTDSICYAVDLATGALKWQRRTGGPIKSTPATGSSSLLYLNGGDGLVYALDRATGKVRWRFGTLGGVLGERKYDFADYHHASPTLHGDTLFVGSGDGRVYALDAQTGRALWNFATNDIVHATPVADGSRVFVSSFDGHLYTLDRRDGRLLWRFKSVGHRYFPKGEMQGAPVLGNGLVYAGSRDYNLYALDAQGGFGHWTKSFPQGWALALTARDTVLYVGTSDDKVLAALDGRTGRELWRTDAKFNVFGGCAFGPTTVHFGTLMGKIFGLDQKTGAVRWVFATEGYRQHRARYFKPDDTFRDDIRSVIGSYDEFLVMYLRLGAVFSAPVVVGNRLLAGSADGAVYCLESR